MAERVPLPCQSRVVPAVRARLDDVDVPWPELPASVTKGPSQLKVPEVLPTPVTVPVWVLVRNVA